MIVIANERADINNISLGWFYLFTDIQNICATYDQGYVMFLVVTIRIFFWRHDFTPNTYDLSPNINTSDMTKATSGTGTAFSPVFSRVCVVLFVDHLFVKLSLFV